MGKLAIYTPKAVVEDVIPPERLTPNWFRRRASWQAVSDLPSEPELAPDLAAIALQRLSQRSDGGRCEVVRRSSETWTFAPPTSWQR
jgi:hypothetical protein